MTWVIMSDRESVLRQISDSDCTLKGELPERNNERTIVRRSLESAGPVFNSSISLLKASH